jgi:hypothetical protein
MKAGIMAAHDSCSRHACSAPIDPDPFRAHAMSLSFPYCFLGGFRPLAGAGLLLSALCAGTVVQAEDLLLNPMTGSSAIDLHFARDEIGLQPRVAGTHEDINMRLSRLGISYAEQFDHGLSLSLSGGALRASRRGEDSAAGMRFRGNYVDVGLRSALPVLGPVRFGLAAHLSYQWMKDRDSTQRIEIEWLQADLAATARIALNDWISLYGGGRQYFLRIDQDTRGAGEVEFEAARGAGGFAGLLFEAQPGGQVGLEVRRGASDGFALTFQQHF